ncbi:MAG: family 20 glycosylhydrolase [Aliidongia sp.]
MVLRLIDLLALYKMNALHLHLTDDEGWRLEMPSLPRADCLWQCPRLFAGRARLSAALLRLRPGGVAMGRAAGVSARRISSRSCAMAKARHIEVIPEIDLPGHARARDQGDGRTA